jgi:hypothetical protein
MRRLAERRVEQKIIDYSEKPYGSYVVTYHPALTYPASPKIEIRLPGTEYIIIVDPNKSGEDSGVVIVHPSGAVANIRFFKDQSELMSLARDAGVNWALPLRFVRVRPSHEIA